MHTIKESPLKSVELHRSVFSNEDTLNFPRLQPKKKKSLRAKKKNRIIITRDKFSWIDVTEKAERLFKTGMLELYQLYEDESESLIQSEFDLQEALENKRPIVIENGFTE